MIGITIDAAALGFIARKAREIEAANHGGDPWATIRDVQRLAREIATAVQEAQANPLTTPVEGDVPPGHVPEWFAPYLKRLDAHAGHIHTLWRLTKAEPAPMDDEGDRIDIEAMADQVAALTERLRGIDFRATLKAFDVKHDVGREGLEARVRGLEEGLLAAAREAERRIAKLENEQRSVEEFEERLKRLEWIVSSLEKPTSTMGEPRS